MRFVTLFGHGPNWQHGRTVFEQGPIMDEHLRSMRRRFDEGTLLLGGPFADDGGGIAVIEAPDNAAATAIIDADPAVTAGILTYRLHHLRAYFDAMASVRTESTVADLATEAAAAL